MHTYTDAAEVAMKSIYQHVIGRRRIAATLWKLISHYDGIILEDFSYS